MKKIITLNGIQYELNSDLDLSQEQLNIAIEKSKEQLNTVIEKSNKVNNVSLAIPYSIVQGTTKDIVIIASSGTAPYKYTIIMDTTPIATNIPFIGTSVSVPHLFNESVGNHTLKVSIIDSCETGALTSNVDTSTITITALCTPPICEFTLF